MKTATYNKNKDNPRVFSFYNSPISNTKPSCTFSLTDVYNYITGSRAVHNTHQLRAIEDSNHARKFKASHFDYCTFSGTFQYRNDKALIQHSGLLCLDFDHLDNLEEVKNKLLQDEYFDTMLMFISPSGDGLKWIVEIDIKEATHRDWFNSISNYLMHTYSLQADKSGKDISRACFLPHDPFCYINPKLSRNEQETI